MINHKIEEHLSFDGLLQYKFIAQFDCERIFKIGEHLAKLQLTGKMVDRVICPIRLRLLSSKMQNSPVSKITCVLRTETVTDCYYVNRQINVSLFSANIKLL